MGVTYAAPCDGVEFLSNQLFVEPHTRVELLCEANYPRKWGRIIAIQATSIFQPRAECRLWVKKRPRSRVSSVRFSPLDGITRSVQEFQPNVILNLAALTDLSPTGC